MHKNILTVVGITILFLGLAIQPSIATVQPEKIDVKPDIEGLVARLRVAVSEIIQEYGHIPMVRILCNMILDSLGLIGTIIYCIALIILFIPVAILFLFFGLVLRIEYIAYTFGAIALFLLSESDLNCPPSNPIFDKPLKSIFTLKDIEDISNLVDECPCMQE